MPVKPYKKASEIQDSGMSGVKTDRRACSRIPVRAQARFFYGNRIYAGDILDISERGMFVRSDIRLPVNSRIDIMILINRNVVKIPVIVRRTAQGDRSAGICINSGMGVEVTRPVKEYTDFMQSVTSNYRN